MKRLFVVISIKKIVIVLCAKTHALFRLDFVYERSFCDEFSEKFLGSGGCVGRHSWVEGVVKRLSFVDNSIFKVLGSHVEFDKMKWPRGHFLKTKCETKIFLGAAAVVISAGEAWLTLS
jgi:hypothetical protein